MRQIVIIAILISLFSATPKWSAAGELKSPASDCYLPSWLFEHQGFIGISDPKLDSVTGIHQALTRALTMYSLSEMTNLKVVYELYYHNENKNVSIDGQKSHWLSELSSEMKNYRYDILNYFVTKYGETIVEIAVCDSKSSDNMLKTNMSMYFSYESNGRQPSYYEKILFEIKSQDNALLNQSWVSTTDRNKTNRYSSNDSMMMFVKNESRYYGNVVANNCENYVFSDLKYGLWNAYIDVFLQEISNFRSRNAEVKVFGRNIINEYSGDFNDKNQRITRMIYNTDISCELRDIILSNNMIYAKWDFVENNDFENKEIVGTVSYQYDGYGYQKVSQDGMSKSRNESIRSASLHADSELIIMALSSVNKNREQYNLNVGDMVIDTTSVSSRGCLRRINTLKENSTTLKNNAYITTITKEIIVE